MWAVTVMSVTSPAVTTAEPLSRATSIDATASAENVRTKSCSSWASTVIT